MLELLVGKVGKNDKGSWCSRVWKQRIVVGHAFAPSFLHPDINMAEEFLLFLGGDKPDFFLGALTGIMCKHIRLNQFSVVVDGSNVVFGAFLKKQYTIGSGHIAQVLVAKLNNGEWFAVCLYYGDGQMISLGSPCSDGHAGDEEG